MNKFVRQPPDGLEDAVLVAGGEVDEYRVSLGFYGDTLDPKSVSAALGRLPTSSSVKGDIVYKNERSRIERTGKWLLSVTPKAGETLTTVLEDLFSTLTDDSSVWKHLSEKYKTRFVVSCWIRSWNRGLEVPPQLLQRIADRRLSLGIDIYVDYEEGPVQ